MCDILVEHDSVKNARILNLASRYLLRSSITLDVDFVWFRGGFGFGGGISGGMAVCEVGIGGEQLILGDCSDSTKGEGAHQLRVAGYGLCADRGLDEFDHCFVIGGIDWARNFLDNS